MHASFSQTSVALPLPWYPGRAIFLAVVSNVKDPLSLRNGETHYLWRAVDYDSTILESFVTRTRDKAPALKFMKKTMKRVGSPEAITTDGLRSYMAAMKKFGNPQKQKVGGWATTGSRTITSRSNDESDRCCGSNE